MINYLSKVAICEDGSKISITRFSENDMNKHGYTDEAEFISFYMNKVFPGKTFTVVDDSNIPKDGNGKWDKSKRAFWSLSQGTVVVDQAKVDAHNLKLAEKAAKKTALLGKLKIDGTDLSVLKEVLNG